jgi:site-specific recombinase XerD
MERFWEVKQTLANKENQEAVNEFLLSLKLGNRSEQTIISYRKTLEGFFRGVEELYSSLTSDQIVDWFQTHKSHLKESSYKQNLTVLSSFYNFCVNEQRMERSPIKKRWFPRPPKALPKYLEKGEMAKVRQESERSSVRDQVLVEFFLTSGCRVREVHLLNIGEVDLENRTARVVGKGKKIRDVHFSDKCAILLERYLDSRHTKEPSSPLFVTYYKETRLAIPAIQGIVRKMGKDAGLSGSLHPHRFRHTFATELMAKGAEMSFISDELGHANVATTQIYARIPNQVILSQYRKFMG